MALCLKFKKMTVSKTAPEASIKLQYLLRMSQMPTEVSIHSGSVKGFDL